MTLHRLKPAVPKCWLYAAAGVMWSAVGVMMGATGIGWLMPEKPLVALGCVVAGIVLAAVVLRRWFDRLAIKNIRRLHWLPERGCFFAFQAWKSYLIVLIMIALGIVLRHLPIPKPALAVIYAAIGGALVLGSLPYYRHLLRLRRVTGRANG